MTPIDVHSRLTAVLRLVFKAPALEVSAATTAQDVPGWDSLAHLALIAEVEGEFGIKFKLKELMSIENVGDIERLISAKIPPLST